MNFLQSRKLRFSIVSNLLLLLGATAAHAEPLKAYCDGHMPQATFVLEELRSALDTPITQLPLSAFSREATGPQVVLATTADAAVLASMKAVGRKPSEDIESEGFSIRVTTKDDGATYWVIGADAAGLMYGGLELAEVARIGGLESVEDLDQNAYMAMRGTKFNIPLDVRTPTYTEPCDAAQKNMPEMWNLDFWKEYIDNLARHRYNFVSLWSLQPFPSMVKTPGYEDVALDDVRRSTIEWKEYYNGTGVGFDAPEIVDNYETLKEMPIEEKIDFWRQVMHYAKGRNVVFYVGTWNIFVNGTDGKHGITDSIKNPTTRDYFRKSVKQMLLTYPDLGGVGLTTGENMRGAKFDEKEDWAFETYGQGVLDAAAEMPDRKIQVDPPPTHDRRNGHCPQVPACHRPRERRLHLQLQIRQGPRLQFHHSALSPGLRERH